MCVLVCRKLVSTPPTQSRALRKKLPVGKMNPLDRGGLLFGWGTLSRPQLQQRRNALNKCAAATTKKRSDGFSWSYSRKAVYPDALRENLDTRHANLRSRSSQIPPARRSDAFEQKKKWARVIPGPQDDVTDITQCEEGAHPRRQLPDGPVGFRLPLLCARQTTAAAKSHPSHCRLVCFCC